MELTRILVVDDEIIIARELEARLQGMGYEVSAIAATGPEAVALAERIQPDLVLMDIVLKGDMDGIEAATEIRRTNDVPVIYVTAYTDRHTLERARVTQPFGYIVKPFSERELQANIEMALYRHRVERRFRRMEQWFTAATNDIGEAVIAADRHGKVTQLNPAAEAITRWTRAAAIGRPLGDVLRIVRRANGTPIALEDAAEGPMVCLAAETFLIDRAGQSIPTDCTVSNLRDETGQPAGMVAVFRDLTGRMYGALSAINSDVAAATAQAPTLADMLQQCSESLERHLYLSLARIWTVNTTGDTLLLKGSAGMHTNTEGRNSQIPIGQNEIGEVARNRKPYHTNSVATNAAIVDHNWVRQSGLTSFSAYPLLVDERLVGVLAVFGQHPMSDGMLEALESVANAIAVGVERKRLEEQLRHAQRMEVVGQLAGGIAHDFNNLMTIVSGCSQILLAGGRLAPDERELVTQIVDAGNRATALTRQLLAFGRKQVLHPRRININTLTSELEQMLRRLIGEQIVLTTVLAPDLAEVMADPGQIEQVLMNLVVNSADAMPDGGRLTIETRNVVLDDSVALSQMTIVPGNYTMLAVSDTGCGMSQNVLAHVFEPFFTTKGAGRGTGLGLATVYGIVRQSAGYIGIYSEPGIGTTVKVYLPATDGTATAPTQRTVTRAQASSSFGDETVLIVEDEPAVRAISRYILQQCGYFVLEAADTDEALLVASQHPGKIHIIVTDVVLPGGGGRLLAERIVISRPETRVLYMSGYTDDAVIRHGVLQSETAFIQKPFTPSGLARKVREVLDKQP